MTVTPPARSIDARYDDPLDAIWQGALRALGLSIELTDEAYVAFDGRHTLWVATAATRDADDCLAQMIFHELCHAIVEGPTARARADWGLDNTGERDRAREHAALRVQAALAGEHGLRRVLAPTTDHRGYYDALPRDPFDGGGLGDPAAGIAAEALERATRERDPWLDVTRRALAATRVVVAAAAPFAEPSSLVARLDERSAPLELPPL